MANEQWKYNFFLRSAFIIYILGLIWLLFVNVGGTDRSTYFVNPDDHFLPFESSKQMVSAARTLHYERYYVLTVIENIAGNIILFIPLGFLLPLLNKYYQRLYRVAVLGAITSFTVETIQFVFSIGIFDVDDIIYNTTGAICGFLILCILKFFRQFPETTHPFSMN